MSRAREWYRWERRAATELYLLWGLAAIFYGGGDVLTTIVLVYAVPGVGEANPFVHWGLATFGIPGLVAMKLSVFGLGVSLSWVGLEYRDRLLYYAPPLCMFLFGLGATVVNLRLIL
ncbi:hypothetical protein KM295_13365 [Natronomonas sp. F2-12]|jgi:hypothetical protein|uniref:DUF5658 domain-containing protein n=1 Tax=Natronomonas aquatica TaxID=2841590 RepID=A0A9R1D7A7_9EURY|nr:hypothetical protein [Natronomonas aquatica]MCQ4334447.1 hypothetical protein [Natronomonas aquatica]